jgi:hypothetical protein
MTRTNSGKAPTMIVWVISLVLFLLAIGANFGFVHVDGRLALWSWVLGYGLLLLACRVRGL